MVSVFDFWVLSLLLSIYFVEWSITCIIYVIILYLVLSIYFVEWSIACIIYVIILYLVLIIVPFALIIETFESWQLYLCVVDCMNLNTFYFIESWKLIVRNTAVKYFLLLQNTIHTFLSLDWSMNSAMRPAKKTANYTNMDTAATQTHLVLWFRTSSVDPS